MIYFLVYLFLEILITYEFAKLFSPVILFFEIIISFFIGVSIIKDLPFSMSETLMEVIKREITEEEFFSIGMFRFIGAILLIIPGILTDIIGILMLFEPFAKFVSKKFSKKEEIIEAELIE